MLAAMPRRWRAGLFGLGPWDADGRWAAAVLIIVVVTVVAAYFPARRGDKRSILSLR